jgi:hypothetical protein
MSRDGAVDIATGNRLDGRGSNSGRGKDFLLSAMSRPAVGSTHTPIQWILGALSPKASSAEVKNGGATTNTPHVFSWHND